MERPTALLFDDLDHAPADAIDGIARIVGAGEPLYGRTFVVATAAPATLARIPAAIRSRAAVRIELAGWDERDVGGFVAASLARVGGDAAIFSPDAIGTITRFSSGSPRLVCQLAQLAIAAAAGEGLERVDAAAVERVWRELAPMATARAAHEPAAREDAVDHELAAAPQAKVRVVRKLWG